MPRLNHFHRRQNRTVIDSLSLRRSDRGIPSGIAFQHKIHILKHLLTLLLLLLAFELSAQELDMLLVNANTYLSADAGHSEAAVGIAGDKIAFVGEAQKGAKLLKADGNIIDLKGKMLTAGFIESHGHLIYLGYYLMNLQLHEAEDFSQILKMVEQAAKDKQPGEWITGRGWHQDKWDKKPDDAIKGMPINELLNQIAPDNPVYLGHASGHMALVNDKALQIAEIEASTEVIGGEISLDNNGDPTGLLIENAIELVLPFTPAYSNEDLDQALRIGLEECVKNGITTFVDAGSDAAYMDVMEDMAKARELPVRLYVMVSGLQQSFVDKWIKRGPAIDLYNGFFTVRSIKLSADGALGSRGAWLLEEYHDHHGHFGHETIPMKRVFEVSKMALANGFQVCVHAIGDRANREVLDQFEQAFKLYPDVKDHRFRIEHAQHLHPDEIPRFAELDVIASMQGIHMSSDRPWAIDRLGEKRIKEGAYVWQKLFESGALVVNGTDTPVEPINPIACYYASISRKTLEGTPEEGYEADQRMSREQALQTYTELAAKGIFMEDKLGTIKVGNLADLTVFTKDLQKIKESEILSTKVAMTIVGGKIAYQLQE